MSPKGSDQGVGRREPGSPLSPKPNPPGGEAALPAGSLSQPFLGPQGDENRDPPASSPSTPPAEKVDDDSTAKSEGKSI